ncbi:light-regulated signal transduction histidine kinase (bacteriophytochrome) [Sphingomonas vulcanisoli]|uniref:Light-regulated signal transduction histidine kinase (Bacteriophytochrome) n=1 Tax=Sphingomonas vulcanisoli TaxID=1658060 RepID=A0ABX0TWZ0_9SPHN|nr:histidine kinase dimerization/phosphoacceptor domain -containing protein [Sphingomonas vulcanisoli]NIJ08937.1 light-regulated signal transduction histidine kinase (bacteriophytochrome) [Sphingomonas vulcanisoli]
MDLTACDREPIHIPGSIQPHGLLLIADIDTLEVLGGAGDIEGRLTPTWLGRRIDALLAQDLSAALTQIEPGMAVPLAVVPGRTENFSALLHCADHRLAIELEPVDEAPLSAAQLLAKLDRAAAAFERATDLVSLCERAAPVFRELTGFDRVMIYRFLDDGAGVVIAEDKDPDLHGFLNHHFPAADIPRQARALYVRNRTRVIPDVRYAPAPIRPADMAGINLTDVGIRSVSPIHLQYLRNMGVSASASVSIIKDGLLWGLIACHHMTPRTLSYETRAACAALASGLARQIRAKEEAEAYRERIRLRSSEDLILGRVGLEENFENFIELMREELRRMMGGDGFAAIQGSRIITSGRVPTGADLIDLDRWLQPRLAADTFTTRSLPAIHPAAEAYAEIASGVLAIGILTDTPITMIWFRAEERETVEWAGNPHKDLSADPDAILTPRNSFEAWSEEVRGRSRAWTLSETEAAGRLRRQLFESRQSRRLRELNRELAATIRDKEALIHQKDHLLGEVNHRVQNSLQLVQAFLGLQERATEEGGSKDVLREAQRRISAVALVHRRLYQADQVDTVDLARYLEDLIVDMRESMGPEWADALKLDLAPILISADRAVSVGLILTELVINANKYAYDGGAGPIAITLEPYRNQFRLIVADSGKGQTRTREGFGTRMMNAMVQRLSGTIELSDNHPGLRVIVSAPADSA